MIPTHPRRSRTSPLVRCLVCALLTLVPLVAAGRTSAADELAAPMLPAEARATLERIHAGGPFPYERDGVVFGNRERLLPLIHGSDTRCEESRRAADRLRGSCFGRLRVLLFRRPLSLIPEDPTM